MSWDGKLRLIGTNSVVFVFATDIHSCLSVTGTLSMFYSAEMPQRRAHTRWSRASRSSAGIQDRPSPRKGDTRSPMWPVSLRMTMDDERVDRKVLAADHARISVRLG
jgi:hypothetical protein